LPWPPSELDESAAMRRCSTASREYTTALSSSRVTKRAPSSNHATKRPSKAGVFVAVALASTTRSMTSAPAAPFAT
jgi:hypothetical protein